MRLTLQPHPDWPAGAVTGIEVDAVRTRRGGLTLDYRLTGTIDRLSIAPAGQAVRADGLWRHTCFEAFLKASTGEPYHEFNFAPSGQWAAYRFDTYRDGMADAEIPALAIATCATEEFYELKAALDATGLPDLPSDSAWSLGLSAVVEEKDGRKSYWALAHPPGKADFHHKHCFAHQLPAPEPL